MKQQQRRFQKKFGVYTTTNWNEGNSGTGINPTNMSTGRSLQQRSLLTTDEILRIKRPYLLVMTSGLEPAVTNCPDLSEWYFNSMLGLGDPKWNTQVRKEREEAREVRTVTPLQIWKIEDDIKGIKEKEMYERRRKNMPSQMNKLYGGL